MNDAVSSALFISSAMLRHQLENGSRDDILSARDNLRAKMVEQYWTGFFRQHPDKLRNCMDLLYRCDRILVSLAPVLGMRGKKSTKLDEMR